MIVYGKASELRTSNARPKKHLGKVTAPAHVFGPRFDVDGDLVVEGVTEKGEACFMRVVSAHDEELIRIARVEEAKAQLELSRRRRALREALLRAAKRGEVVRIPTRRERENR